MVIVKWAVSEYYMDFVIYRIWLTFRIDNGLGRYRIENFFEYCCRDVFESVSYRNGIWEIV